VDRSALACREVDARVDVAARTVGIKWFENQVRAAEWLRHQGARNYRGEIQLFVA
jgi:hypothetical protein